MKRALGARRGDRQMREPVVRTFYTSSSRPQPGAGRTTPDGMRGRTLPLRSRAAARLWAAGHAPARAKLGDVKCGHPRWPQIILHDPEESTPLRASIPPVATWQDMRRLSSWSGSGIGGSGLTPRAHVKSGPGSRGWGRLVHQALVYQGMIARQINLLEARFYRPLIATADCNSSIELCNSSDHLVVSDSTNSPSLAA